VLAELISDLFLPIRTLFMGSPITKVGFPSLINFEWLKSQSPRCTQIYFIPGALFSSYFIHKWWRQFSFII